jgi:hypothetical protein
MTVTITIRADTSAFQDVKTTPGLIPMTDWEVGRILEDLRDTLYEDHVTLRVGFRLPLTDREGCPVGELVVTESACDAHPEEDNQ